MATKSRQNDPEMDFGFYASIPRIVRTGYRTGENKLSIAQKLAYYGLKDLCGETGTCFRTIANLAEELGLSTGATDTAIHRLHEVGLIHAEKKARRANGPEIWHISIVDIWRLNAKAHPTRSAGEQNAVQQVNENKGVQQVNENRENRSLGERPPSENRSPSETEERSIRSKGITEERSGDDSANRSASNPSGSQQNFAPPQTRGASAVQAPKGRLDGVNLSLTPDIPDVSPLSPEQLRRQVARRMDAIMKLVDATLEVRLPRNPETWVKQALQDMIAADWDDTVIVKAVQDLQAKGRAITYTTISQHCATMQISARPSRPATPPQAERRKTADELRLEALRAEEAARLEAIRIRNARKAAAV